MKTILALKIVKEEKNKHKRQQSDDEQTEQSTGKNGPQKET
jgi:hypothetical protein